MKTDWQTWLAKRQTQLRVDLVASSIIGVLTVTAYLTVIAPARDSRAVASTNAARLASEQARILQLGNTLATLRTQREAAISLPFGTLPQFTSINDLNSRLAKLTDLAASNDLQIDTIEPDAKPTSTPMFTLTRITIGARGSDENCQRFIATLHEQMRDLIVTSLDLASPAPGDPDAFNLQLLWYASPTISQAGR